MTMPGLTPRKPEAMTLSDCFLMARPLRHVRSTAPQTWIGVMAPRRHEQSSQPHRNRAGPKFGARASCLTTGLALLLTLGVFQTAGPVNAGASDETYRLGVGDHLRIAVLGRRDMEGEYTVRPPGMISFPVIG